MIDWVGISYLPEPLLRVTLEFAGSLSNKQTRLHQWVCMEMLIFKTMHAHMYTPQRLIQFYTWHGRNRIKKMFSKFTFKVPYVTNAMTRIC